MKITLWTIQTLEAWNQLNQEGFLTVSKNYIEQDYVGAYNWMKEQMIQRIGRPDYNSQYPLWAWYQFYDENRKRPDLRKTAHLPTGTRGVRIEFSMEQKNVLLSDFLLWDLPLFYKGFIADTEIEDQQFDKIIEEKKLEKVDFSDYPKYLKERITRSWEKIFDLDFDDKYFTVPRQEKRIQACFWKLSLGDVVRADEFVAR